MSPEQAELSGLDIDTRSDIYCAGRAALRTADRPHAVRHAEAAGQPGFDAMRRTIREEEPPKPSTRLSTLAAAELTTVAAQRGTPSRPS